MIAPTRSSSCERCHITVPELMELWQALRAPAAVAAAAAASTVVLRLDRTGGCHAAVSGGRGEAWGGATRAPRRARPGGRDRRRSGGRRRMARRGPWPAPARLPRHGIRAGASRDGRPGAAPSPWRRWGPSPAAGCGISTPASARRPPRWRGRGQGGERGVGPARRGRGRSAGAGGPAARRPGRGRARPLGAARPGRHQSTPHRHGCAGDRRARAAPAGADGLHLVRSRDARAGPQPAARLPALADVASLRSLSADRARGDGRRPGAGREVHRDGARSRGRGRGGRRPGHGGRADAYRHPGSGARHAAPATSAGRALGGDRAGGRRRWPLGPHPPGRACGARGRGRADAAHPEPDRQRRPARGRRPR